MNELALFSGPSGSILASILLGWRVVCAVEIDAYCREVLLRRQEEGYLEPFPIWDDVRTFDGTAWRGAVDIVTAGFPCQPFSVAGKRLGEDDERNMWPDTIRIIGEVRPRYALLENVPGLLVSGYMGRVFGDISELGYDARWGVVGADDVGAPHRRKRLWIVLSDTTGIGSGTRRTECEGQKRKTAFIASCSVADPERSGLEGAVAAGDTSADGRAAERRCRWWDIDPADLPDTESTGCAEKRIKCGKQNQGRTSNGLNDGCSRSTQSRVGRVAHGVAYRVDRLKVLGNGQVPAVVREAWKILNDRP